jgi:hypothetical protein
VLSLLALFAWIRSLELPRAEMAVLDALARLIDWKTGKSHRRHSISIKRLIRETGYAKSTILAATKSLEAAGHIRRGQSRPWYDIGRFWQDSTIYEILVPDECWHEVKDASETAAARPVEPRPVRGEAWTSPAALTLSVRGTYPTRDASTDRERAKARPTSDPTADLVSPEELAAQLVETACIAAADVREERRFVAVAAIEGLRRRAPEIANIACRGGTTSTRVNSAVRAWVAKCLAGDAKIETAEHAVNMLRRFMVMTVYWSEMETAARMARGCQG